MKAWVKGTLFYVYSMAQAPLIISRYAYILLNRLGNSACYVHHRNPQVNLGTVCKTKTFFDRLKIGLKVEHEETKSFRQVLPFTLSRQIALISGIYWDCA